MAYIIETPNAFEPLRSIKRELDRNACPITIRQWVLDHQPTGEFPVPTICLVNGQPLMRADWDRQIEATDIVNFVAIPAGIIEGLAIALVVVLVAITIVMVLNRPKMPGEQPASDPVFTIKGQQNEIRLGEPIEVNYGRNRIYPSMASRPYFEYRDNDQFQFSLFCLGQGEYDIEAIQIGDTVIDNFEEVQYEVIPPGGTVTLLPVAVYTAVEAGGQILYGSNQPEYVAPGWVGPFPANPSGTIAYKIQVDVSMLKGLYRMTKSGKPDYWTVQFAVQIRLIDDLGMPLGSWEDLTGDPYIEIIGATTTPQRRSIIEDVTPGRYEVRLRRVNFAGNLTDAPPVSNVGDELTWEALRSYIEGEQDFGDVTLLAVIIRATNNLNSRTQQKFNVICTRKLPIRESGGTWSAVQPTRSIVWALVDIFRSVYGGRIFDDAFYDWDALEELDELYEERDEHFDWTFRDPVTVWEAAQAVARVGRATPLLAGSLITLRRDGPLEIPVAMFNQENIIQGSFSWEIKLWDLDEYDSVRIEYTEPATGYLQEQVLATLPGGTTDHPEDIRFAGIQDRAHAYHEGMYLVATRRYLRENVTFETGLEGFIPTFGDLIAVAHDVPRWGQAGYVVNAERGVNSYQLWLSEPVTFNPDVDYAIALRGRRAEIIGPLNASATTDPKQVYVESPDEIDFLLDGTTEPTLFVFGPTAQTTKYLRVVKVEPQNSEVIRITGVTDAPVIHSFDELLPPALNTQPLAPIPPDLPEVAGLTLSQIDPSLHIIQASWHGTFGAQYFIVQYSQDNEHWSIPLTTERTSLQLQVFPGDLWVRVAAVNNGQGPWIQEYLEVGYMRGITVVEEWVGLEWKVSWEKVLLATSYVIKVYDRTDSEPTLKHTASITALEFTYDYLQALIDSNTVRDMRVEVTPVFPPEGDGFSDDVIPPTGIDLDNPVPAPATGLGYELVSEDSDSVLYRVYWTVPTEADLINVKVWLSPISGFDPAVDVPVVDEDASMVGYASMPTEAYLEIALDSTGGHPAYYWRVALNDVWGAEVGTNVAPEQVIPLHV